MLVSEQWEKVKDIVEENDLTYRWLKEQILREVRSIEHKAFRSFLGSSALNVRDRLISLKYVYPDEETFNKVKFWLKQETGKYVLENDDNSSEDRVIACKFALLEASFVYFDEPERVANNFRRLLQKLSHVGGVQAAIEERDNPYIAAQVKAINDAAKEYIISIGQQLGQWPEFNIPTDTLPINTLEYRPPEIWCFGDFGLCDGQICYPEKVAIDQKGQFIVLEEHTIGVGGVETVQRIQLFSAKGKFLKCLLKRGEGKVNGMADMCLTKDGNILVVDEDEESVSRIQIFDYDGNQMLKIITELESREAAPKFNSVAVDPDGRIIAADIFALSVYIFSTDGKVICKFGKVGHAEGEFETISAVSCDNTGKIYVMDSVLKRIQVFDASGSFLSIFGPSRTFLRYMVFDCTRGEVIGSDYKDHKVKVYSMDGTFLREHGKFGTGLNDCWFPYGLALTADGKVAIAERENHRITVLKL